MADGSGMVQTRYTYAPFGARTISGAVSTNANEFTGRENDGTGLYYYRARYYAPTLQRFTAEDPIGISGGDINLAAYVNNSPVNQTDPLGLQTMMQAPWPCRKESRKGGGWAAFLAAFLCSPELAVPFPAMAGSGGASRAAAAAARAVAQRGRQAAADAARKAAAEGLDELASHADKMAKAVQELEQLLDRLSQASPKARGDLVKQITELAKRISGHIAEVADRWR